MTDSAKPTPEPLEIERRPNVMTIEEVAKSLRVNKSTVYRLARERTIPSTKVANQRRFTKASIDELLSAEMAPNR